MASALAGETRTDQMLLAVDMRAVSHESAVGGEVQMLVQDLPGVFDHLRVAERDARGRDSDSPQSPDGCALRSEK